VSVPDPAEGRPFGRRGARVYDALGHLGGLLLAVLAAAVFLQVVLRYVFSTGLEGLDEVPRYVFVWLVMIGAAAAMHRGEHTALHYFRDRLSPRGQATVRVVTNAAAIVLFLSMIKSSLVLVPNAQLQSSAGLGLPLGYLYAAVPVGAALILVPLLWSVVAAARDLLR
jgi:TRAP-type C4-dicarboxylate transport system permease small subunit